MKKDLFLNDDEFDLEKLEMPNEIKNPKDVFGNLISFYDKKIKEIEDKIKDLEKNINIKANENFLNKEHISKYFSGLKGNSNKYLEQSEIIVKNLIDKYKVDIIAIGNGTASRESEKFVADTIKIFGKTW